MYDVQSTIPNNFNISQNFNQRQSIFWGEEKHASLVSEKAWLAECLSAPPENAYDNFTQDTIILSPGRKIPIPSSHFPFTYSTRFITSEQM